jgi:hypothetical protein
MRIFQIAIILLAITSPVLPAESPLEQWVFPGASFKEKGSPSVTSTYPNGQRTEDWRMHFGQYVTDASFQKVLSFYVEQSRISLPNQAIVGREFPGTDVFIPAHWVTRGEFGAGSTVTLLHYIREGCATGVFSVVGHPEFGSLTIVVSRGKDEEQTVIQIICNPKGEEGGQKTEPDGPANGSQPIRSETNRASSPAGSRR